MVSKVMKAVRARRRGGCSGRAQGCLPLLPRYLDRWAMDNSCLRHMALDGWSCSRFTGMNAKSCHGYDSKTTHIMLPVTRKLSGRRMTW